MKRCFVHLLLGLLVFSSVSCENTTEENNESKRVLRTGRGIFNVVSFPNVGCPGTSGRNGTCYTSSECSSKGGVGSGTCASGYGVCCIFQLACGQTSSENCTFLVLAASTTPPSNCVYNICPASPNVCRIRFDFMTFSITGPVSDTSVAAGAPTTTGGVIGDCVTDYFTVTTPGGRGTPQICGFNSNQHIFVDASQACNKASFSFLGSSSVARSYDIKVTQFNCGDEKGGPPECLQYFTSATGRISSFNFPTAATGTTPVTATHLSSQSYDICIRRNAGSCGICYTQFFPPTAGNQGSFGLSLANPAGTASFLDSQCSTDYLLIPNGVGGSPAQIGMGFPAAYNTRFCGRYFTTTAAFAETICTAVRPFRVTFRTDADEAMTGAADTALNNEVLGVPGGITGFSLLYFQFNCPIPVTVP